MRGMYSVTLGLTVKGPHRQAHFGQVVDCYAALENKHEDLLDCAWGLSDQDDHGHVEVSVTLVASDDHEAWELASSSIRAAIHDAGGFTPDWTERAEDADAVEYRLTDEEIAAVAV
jgi:hypothetical protein